MHKRKTAALLAVAECRGEAAIAAYPNGSRALLQCNTVLPHAYSAESTNSSSVARV